MNGLVWRQPSQQTSFSSVGTFYSSAAFRARWLDGQIVNAQPLLVVEPSLYMAIALYNDQY
jgi:hypothetical protein